MPQMSKRLKGQGPISAHYGKKAPCRAHLPMLALVVEARSSANAQWFWVHRAARGGSSAGTKQYRVLEIAARTRALVDLALYRALVDLG
jgi:hypothetical protein